MINKKDIAIIKLLRSNARIKLRQISYKTNIPFATVFQRMKKINTCVIKNTTILNYKKINYPINIIYTIKSSNINKNKIIEFLLKNNNVNNIYSITGSHNILIEAFFIDLNEADIFYEDLTIFNPLKIDQYQIINELKKEEFFT